MFVFDLKLTRQDLLNYYKLQKKVSYRGFYLVFHGLVGLVSLLVYGMSAYLLINHAITESLGVSIAVFTMLLIGYFFIDHLRAALAMKNRVRLGDPKISFEAEGVLAESEKASSRYAYDVFTKLVVSRGAYYLFLNKSNAILLPERCMIKGDPAAFVAFLEEKTGLSMKEIK